MIAFCFVLFNSRFSTYMMIAARSTQASLHICVQEQRIVRTVHGASSDGRSVQLVVHRWKLLHWRFGQDQQRSTQLSIRSRELLDLLHALSYHLCRRATRFATRSLSQSDHSNVRTYLISIYIHNSHSHMTSLCSLNAYLLVLLI